MNIRWGRVFFVLFILALLGNIGFLVSNHDGAQDFIEDCLDSEVGEAVVSLGLLIVLFLLVMKLLAYVVGLFRRG